MRTSFLCILVVAVYSFTAPVSVAEDSAGNVEQQPTRVLLPAGGAAPQLSDAQQRKLDADLEKYRHAVELNPDDAESHIDLGLTLLQMEGTSDDCLNELREAVRLAPENPRAHHELGFALSQIQNIDGALDEFRHAVELKPDSLKYVHDLAVVLASASKCDEAEAKLKQCIESSPTYADAYTDLGLMYLQTCRLALAIEQLSASLKIKETYNARLGRGRAYMLSEQFDAAVDDFSHLLGANPNDDGALVYRAFANVRRHDYEAAVRDANRLLTLGPERAYLGYSVLGAVSYGRKDDKAATEYLAKAIDTDLDQPMPYILRAVVRLREVELTGCLEDLTAATSSTDDVQELNRYLDGYGWLVFKFRGHLKLFGFKDYKGAAKDLKQAIALNDKDADCYALLAATEYQLGDWKAVLTNAERAVQLQPDHVLGTIYLVAILSTCPDATIRDVHRAADVAKLACTKTSWKSSFYIAQLASTYARLGEFENAQAMQEQAIEQLSKSDDQLPCSFSMVLWWNLAIVQNFKLDKETADEVLEQYRQGKSHQGSLVAALPGMSEVISHEHTEQPNASKPSPQDQSAPSAKADERAEPKAQN